MNMNHLQLNQKVCTPLGTGLVNGFYEIFENNGGVEHRVLVRIQVTDQNRGELKNDFCMTPHAVFSAVWSFAPAEVTC